MSAGGTIGILTDMLQLRREGEEEAYDDYKEEFAAINRTLRKLGLPEHNEPEDIRVWTFDLGPVGGLHALRRVAAHLDEFGELPPPRPKEVGGRDSVVQEYYDRAEHCPRRFDHLVMHSDCDGYYLPVDFPRVIYSRRGLEVPYHMIGSSHRLLAECRELAKAMGAPARLSPSKILERWRSEEVEPEEKWCPYDVEAFVCLTLMRAAKRSIDVGAAIWFS